jgi:hypothetical protein
MIGLALASTIMIAGLAVWTWYDFSDVLADAETIDSSTAMAMDAVARSSLQAVDGVLESVVGRIDGKATLEGDLRYERFGALHIQSAMSEALLADALSERGGSRLSNTPRPLCG